MKLYDSYRKVEIEHPDHVLKTQLELTLGRLAERKGLGYHNKTINDGKKILNIRILKDVKGKSNYNAKSGVMYVSLRDMFEADLMWSLIKQFFGRS